MRVQLLGYDMNGEALSITCRHVMDGEPIVEVAHDVDGVVQALCAVHDHGFDDARTVHLHHLAGRLQALDLPRIEPGQYAQLTEGGWSVMDMPPEDEDA